MLEMHFETEQGVNYLVVSCREKIIRDCYRCVVLEHNHVPCFLNYHIRELNGVQSVYYEMSYRITLKQILGDLRLDYDFVKQMMGSIVDVITQVREYLLDINEVVWKVDAVFVEVNTGRLKFIYYPGNRNVTGSLKQFLGEIIPFVEKKDQQAYLYIMGFYDLITNTAYSMEELTYYATKEEDTEKKTVDYAVVDEMNEKDIDEMQDELIVIAGQDRESVVKKNSIHGITLAVVALFVLIEILLLLIEILPYHYIWILPISLFVLFVLLMTYRIDAEKEDPDTIMNEYFEQQQKQSTQHVPLQAEQDEVLIEETTVLSEDQVVVTEERSKEKYLESKNASVSDDIMFHKAGIVLGTMVSACDVVVRQKGISRMHAKICIRETGIYVLDLNSTNGTYLNGERLHCGDEYPLEIGDVLSLAGIVEFEMKEREGSDV